MLGKEYEGNRGDMASKPCEGRLGGTTGAELEGGPSPRGGGAVGWGSKPLPLGINLFREEKKHTLKEREE